MKNCLFSFDQLSTDANLSTVITASDQQFNYVQEVEIRRVRKDKQTGMKTVGEQHSMRSKGQHVELFTQTNLLLSFAVIIPYIALLCTSIIFAYDLARQDPIDLVGYPKVN